MPRKERLLTPVYEIETVDDGELRVQLTHDRRRVVVEVVPHGIFDQNGEPDGRSVLLDSIAWQQLCGLVDTLMPKRSRNGKKPKKEAKDNGGS